MNREAIKKVRDHIAGLNPALFNMGRYAGQTECGTCACIAGWTDVVVCGFSEPTGGSSTARAALGLSDEDAFALFYVGDPDSNSPGWARWKATPPQAVRVLDHLLETGEVDWSIIDQPETEGAGQ